MSNIHELLYRMKENINAVEDGDTDVLLLSDIRDDFLKFLELVKLFLISERDSYYGYFLMNMQFRVNFSNKSIAGIKLNEFPAVLEANPLLLCKFHIKAKGGKFELAEYDNQLVENTGKFKLKQPEQLLAMVYRLMYPVSLGELHKNVFEEKVIKNKKKLLTTIEGQLDEEQILAFLETLN